MGLVGDRYFSNAFCVSLDGLLTEITNMALTHISQPLNGILNRIQALIDENDKITRNEEVKRDEEKPTSLLSEEDVATMFSISPIYLKSLRYRRVGPSFHKVGGIIRYKYEDVLNYLDSVKSK